MLEEYIIETIKKELAKQKLNGIYGKNKHELKQENEKLKENIKWLQNDKDVLLKQVSQQYEEYEKLEQQNEKLKQENEDANLELETIMNTVEILGKENEKLKKENEQLKNLSCTIVVGNEGKIDSLFNQKLKQENDKLVKKLINISSLVTSYNNLKETGDLTFFSLMCAINDIENILKES